MIDFNELVFAAEDRQVQRETQRQNSARLAFSTHRQTTKGSGTIDLPEPIRFDVAFLAEPHFTSGAVLLKTEPGWHAPTTSSVVRGWLRNEKGHYLGAYLTVHVSASPVDGFYQSPPELKVSHHLLFLGIGFKDLGTAITREAETLSPKRVGWGGRN